MARDKGLEELVYDELRSVPGVTDKAMFGGWAWLLWGNLLCGARDDGMLVRLGKATTPGRSRLPGLNPCFRAANTCTVGFVAMLARTEMMKCVASS